MPKEGKKILKYNHGGKFMKFGSLFGFYRSKDCMEMFCKDLKEHASKIINYEKEDYIVIR